MKKIVIAIYIAILFFNPGCFKVPTEIPEGEWNYKLFTNNVLIGSSKISNFIVEDNYVLTSELKLGIGNVSNISRHVIVETKSFAPVKLESYSKITTTDLLHETEIKAIFNGKKIEITSGNKKTTYYLDKNFILEGNFFLAKLIEGKFKKGLEIMASIYDPSIELEKPISVKTEVIGIKNVEIKGKGKSLIHIVQFIENIKIINIYLDENGIMIKGTIEMLNMKIEIIKE